MSQPADADPTIITPGLLRAWPVEVGADGEDRSSGGKHARGAVLVVGGARATPGAVVLAGLAALRAGAGKLTVALPASTAVPVAVAVPECGAIGLPETDQGAVAAEAADTLAGELDRLDALLVGPGLADREAAAGLLARLLPMVPEGTPVVLDALALGALGGDRSLVDPVRGRVVLTPNRTEAGLLLGSEPGEHDLQVAAAIAETYGAVVSYGSAVVHPDGRRWLAQTGHIGLGTSGSGDVLAGLVTGALARAHDLAQAACWGTHLHGASGDRLAARVGRLGFLAREILDEVPHVLVELSV